MNLPKNYTHLLSEVRTTIVNAQIRAIRAVNRELVLLYWEIGKKIVERQVEEGWGKSIVEQLSKDLKAELVDSQGFSTRNLWEMRKFYQTYKDFPNLQPLVAEIPWTHNRIIMDKIKDHSARAYYLEATANNGWSKAVLRIKIDSQDYERQVLNNAQNNFKLALPEYLAEQANEAIKSSYNLEFLGLKDSVKERELESRLIEKIRDFLIELGYGFAFLGSQYKLQLDSKEYFIDLMFFHRKLNCLVAFELKVDGFKPEYAGKLNFYLEVINDTIKEPHENPAIGILLCRNECNSKVEVEYALRGMSNPIGVAQYQLIKELPQEFIKQLPSPEELSEIINQDFKEDDH